VNLPALHSWWEERSDVGASHLTYDDYAALPDDGHRYELYEGELVTMTSLQTSARHQRRDLHE
jgi:hypothetical protein